jgi:hypothetical protein
MDFKIPDLGKISMHKIKFDEFCLTHDFTATSEFFKFYYLFYPYQKLSNLLQAHRFPLTNFVFFHLSVFAISF